MVSCGGFNGLVPGITVQIFYKDRAWDLMSGLWLYGFHKKDNLPLT